MIIESIADIKDVTIRNRLSVELLLYIQWTDIKYNKKIEDD